MNFLLGTHTRATRVLRNDTFVASRKPLRSTSPKPFGMGPFRGEGTEVHTSGAMTTIAPLRFQHSSLIDARTLDLKPLLILAKHAFTIDHLFEGLAEPFQFQAPQSTQLRQGFAQGYEELHLSQGALVVGVVVVGGCVGDRELRRESGQQDFHLCPNNIRVFPPSRLTCGVVDKQQNNTANF